MVSQDICVCAGEEKYNHISVSFDIKGQWKLFLKSTLPFSHFYLLGFFFSNVTH